MRKLMIVVLEWLLAKLTGFRRIVEVIVGLQWGDEGKGAEVMRLFKGMYLVVRVQGGGNAGHTTVVKDPQTGKPGALVLHLLPSSVAWGKRIAIAAGVVVNPFGLIQEVKHTRSFGINPIPHGKLSVDPRCAMVMIYHRVMDMAQEIVKSRERSGKPIGTTAQGIGPTYADITNRVAILMGDLMDWERFCDLFRKRVAEKEKVFQSMGLTSEEWSLIFEQLTEKEIVANKRLLELGLISKEDLDYTRFAGELPGTFNVEEMLKAYLAAHRVIDEYRCITDVCELVHLAIQHGYRVGVEGAQGAHLDLVFGTIPPYVTSSRTIAGGACIGLGIGPTLIRIVRGIMKAYITRVGNGPFPTRMDDETAAAIRGGGETIGDEFGATTGRPRDCGWFDAVIARTGCRLSGVTNVTVTKLDKLDRLTEIQVGVAWNIQGEKFLFTPADSALAEDPNLEVTYVVLPGWQQDISGCKTWKDLPQEAREYIEYLEMLLNQQATEPIVIDRIGVGPAEDDVIVRY